MATAVALQATARSSRLAGSTRQTALLDFALARYNPNGSLDTSFSGDGRLTDRLRGLGGRGACGGCKGDGKIVADGT